MKAKIVSLTRSSQVRKVEDQRISLAKCRAILKGKPFDDYTDEQIIQIRDLLYRLADIALDQHENQERLQSKLISIHEHEQPNYAKSDYLRAG